MRSFLVFLGVIAVIGLVWAVRPVLQTRANDHERRLVASLNLVEAAIVSASADILQVDLFAPEIAPVSDNGQWQVSGVLETQDRTGKAVFARYVATVAFACTPYGDAACGKIESLAIGAQPLVVDGAVVAELQSVLDSAATPGEPLPGASQTGEAAEPMALPAPQIDTATPEPATAPAAPVAVPAAPEPTPAAEAPADPVPVLQVPAATVPAPEDEPTEGDRQIFLIQKNLREKGYDPGPVDGRVGPRTTSAIQAYQRKAGLPVDGQPSAKLLERLSHPAE